MTLTTRPLLVPWSRKSRAIPLLSLGHTGPVQYLSACTGVHFTFHINIHRFWKIQIYWTSIFAAYEDKDFGRGRQCYTDWSRSIFPCRIPLSFSRLAFDCTASLSSSSLSQKLSQSLKKCVQRILQCQWQRETKKEKNKERIKVEILSKKNKSCEDTLFEGIKTLYIKKNYISMRPKTIKFYSLYRTTSFDLFRVILRPKIGLKSILRKNINYVRPHKTRLKLLQINKNWQCWKKNRINMCRWLFCYSCYMHKWNKILMSDERRKHKHRTGYVNRGGGGVCQNTTVLYPTLSLWRHVSTTVGHLQVTKIYIVENYTEYDHSIGAYCDLTTTSRCRLDYTYWAKNTSSK